MPRQNRLTPEGRFEAVAARGLFMGNRGILHDAAGRLGGARWRHPHWIICLTEFRGRRRPLMAPRHYTELFFLDEATALAAGHRPCAECRRLAWLAFRDAFAPAPMRAAELDRVLHTARLDRGRQRRCAFDINTLPDGVLVLDEAGRCPHLLHRGHLLPWSHQGYGAPRPRPDGGMVTVLTPAPTVAALARGYRPVLHPSAG